MFPCGDLFEVMFFLTFSCDKSPLEGGNVVYFCPTRLSSSKCLIPGGQSRGNSLVLLYESSPHYPEPPNVGRSPSSSKRKSLYIPYQVDEDPHRV